MTFEDIDKLNYKQFNSKQGSLGGGGNDSFKPSDILDLDDNDDDDEILRKFKEPEVKSPKRMSPVKKHYRNGNSGTNHGAIMQTINPY
jgi:hypothetical protein